MSFPQTLIAMTTHSITQYFNICIQSKMQLEQVSPSSLSFSIKNILIARSPQLVMYMMRKMSTKPKINILMCYALVDYIIREQFPQCKYHNFDTLMLSLNLLSMSIPGKIPFNL